MDNISLNTAGNVSKILNSEGRKPVSGCSTPEVNEKLAESFAKQVEFAAMIGKSIVKKPLEDFNKGCSEIWNDLFKLDASVGKADNVFENVDAFKEAGGSFKDGHAVIDGKPFVGVIRTNYTENKLAPAHSHRQYAYFGKEGELYQVVTVEDNGMTVVKDKISYTNPGTSNCSIDTKREIYTTTYGSQSYETVLENYGIA